MRTDKNRSMMLLCLPNKVLQLEENLSRAVAQNSLTTLGKQKLLPRETKIWTFESRDNFSQIFSIFELEASRYNKTLNDWPHEKQWVLFSRKWRDTQYFLWGKLLTYSRSVSFIPRPEQAPAWWVTWLICRLKMEWDLKKLTTSNRSNSKSIELLYSFP